MIENERFAAMFAQAMGEPCMSLSVMSGSRTNVNCHVKAASGEYAMRVPGEGTNAYIDRAHEIANLRKVSSFPFVPNLHYADPKSGLVVTEFLTGARSLERADLEDAELFGKVMQTLADVHSSGLVFGNVFGIAQTKTAYEELLASEGFALPAAVHRHAAVLEEALGYYGRCYGDSLIASHGDPNLANFMVRDGQVFLIDWEYSGMCDEYFDLANLSMTDRLDAGQEDLLVELYSQAMGRDVDMRHYRLLKVAIDYMWLFWHLIKLAQGSMVEYNEASWRNRLARALDNLGRIG